MIAGFTPRPTTRETAAPGRGRRVRRRRARRPVDGVRSVRPGEEEGRADCVRGPRLQRVGERRIDARRAPRAVAAVVTGSGRHRHCAGRQRRQSTRTRFGLARHTSGGRARRPRGVDLHRRVRAGGNRRPRRPPRHDALAGRRRSCPSSSFHRSRRERALRGQRPRPDIGGRRRRFRSVSFTWFVATWAPTSRRRSRGLR